ncbi:MAG: HlyD family secretion protein [Acuticoccus sp.]
MLEFMICSLVTILPDYLFRRYGQGKRLGREITVFSVWYELRWGIVTCVMLTITVITMVFYYHPTTNNVTLTFRTVTILPERGGRVEEVFVRNNEIVEAGAPIFRFDDSEQRSALEVARQAVTQAEAALTVARAQRNAAQGGVDEAQAAYDDAEEDLNNKLELQRRNAANIAERQVSEAQNLLDTRQGSLDAALAQLAAVDAQINTLLPAEIASARAQEDNAEILLEKTTVNAGVTGRVEQFVLQPGDYITAILRPAGILVPIESGRERVQAGFDQIASQVLKTGMIAEMVCISKPFVIIPMVIVAVQDVIAAGQIRPTDSLIDLQSSTARPGTLTVAMEPLYADGLDGVPPGSKCIANAYTSNHERLATEDLGTGQYIFLHVVDTVGLVHALILRIQALLFPVQSLVLGGH